MLIDENSPGLVPVALRFNFSFWKIMLNANPFEPRPMVSKMHFSFRRCWTSGVTSASIKMNNCQREDRIEYNMIYSLFIYFIETKEKREEGNDRIKTRVLLVGCQWTRTGRAREVEKMHSIRLQFNGHNISIWNSFLLPISVTCVSTYYTHAHTHSRAALQSSSMMACVS